MNQTGQDNVFLGKMSGFNNISGSANTFIGMNTGVQTTASSDNVFIGTQSGAFKTSGNGNTFVGSYSGAESGTGSMNVFIGNNAGYYETGSSMLYIENSNSTSPLIGGNFNTDKIAVNGIPDPAGATFQVNGDVRLGLNGTNIQSIIKVTVIKDIPSIAAGETYIETFSVPNANIGGAVSISPWMELGNGLVICYSRVSSSGTVEVKFKNTAPLAIDPQNMGWFIAVIQ